MLQIAFISLIQMARIIYSALVESIRGSVGGTTFQANAYGHTIKTKGIPVNRRTPGQQSRKKQISDNARKWITLTEGQRNEWRAYAQAYPIPSRLNANSNLNGYNYFLKYHNIFNQGGINITQASPGESREELEVNSISVFFAVGMLRFSNSLTLTGALWRRYVYITQPISVTKTFANVTPRFIAQDGAESTTNINSEYIALFGRVPEVGDTVGVRIAYLYSGQGQMQFEVQTNVVVTSE